MHVVIVPRDEFVRDKKPRPTLILDQQYEDMDHKQRSPHNTESQIRLNLINIITASSIVQGENQPHPQQPQNISIVKLRVVSLHHIVNNLREEQKSLEIKWPDLVRKEVHQDKVPKHPKI